MGRCRAAILGILLLSSCRGRDGQLEPLEFLIDWQAVPTYVGVYYALASGFFAEAGYDVRIVEVIGANTAATAIGSGKYLIGTASGGATVLAVGRGLPIQSTAVLYQHTPTVIYGLATSGIREPADLYGRRLGVFAGSITVNELEALVKLRGLDRARIADVVLSGSDIPPLKAGQVDAVLNYIDQSPTLLESDESIAMLGGRRTNLIKLSDYGVDPYGLNVIVNRDAWMKRREALSRASEAVVRGYREGCEARQAATAAFLAAVPGHDPQYAARGWDVACGLVGAPHEVGTQNPKRWQDTIDVFARQGLVEKAITVDDVVAR